MQTANPKVGRLSLIPLCAGSVVARFHHLQGLVGDDDLRARLAAQLNLGFRRCRGGRGGDGLDHDEAGTGQIDRRGLHDGSDGLNGSRRRRGGVDPRPLPVGYPEFPVTALPARDGEPQGGVKRSSSAPNCSYFVNWKSRDDSMVWNLDVQTSGRYAVSVDYTCPVPDAGS